MIEKELVQKNFEKRIACYDENAFVQKQMAKKSVELLPSAKYGRVLEIGSYSGLLTKELTNKIEYSEYLALDVVKQSEDYLKKTDEKIKFINEDIENFQTQEKFDLIISNAALQWCSDFEGSINKLKGFLNENGVILLSLFSEGNLNEIKSTFGVSLKYPDEALLKQNFCEVIHDKIILKFNTPIEVLKHLKYTGVNSINKTSFSYKQIKENLQRIENEFNNTLTYTPVYLVYKK